jgi:hypothetical protein
LCQAPFHIRTVQKLLGHRYVSRKMTHTHVLNKSGPIVLVRPPRNQRIVELADLLRPFASSIHAKAGAVRDLDLTANQRARVLESISDDIKKCTNFVVPRVSVAAMRAAARCKIDLRTKNWHDQVRFDRGRRVFHLEHLVPVSAIRKACLERESEAGVLEVLCTRLQIVWILKTEDAKLTKLGYRSDRSEPEAAYRAAGIEIAAQRSIAADRLQAAGQEMPWTTQTAFATP